MENQSKEKNKAVENVLDDCRAKAEALFPEVVWTDEITGYCPCPGQDKHAAPAGARDCRLKIDEVPTMSCFHASCGEEIEAANKALRTAILSSSHVAQTAGEKKVAIAATKAKARHEEELKIRTKQALPAVLKAHAWSYDQIVADSPNPIHADDRQGMFHAFLGLFKDTDIVWIGNVADTGKEHHARNFQTKGQWFAGEIPDNPLTCPSCFVTGSISRSKDNVAAQRYLVVESDLLSKNEVGAIFRWLDRVVELPLRAVVDTAGKSLHGWFEFPPPDVLAELKIMLPAMNCDSKMFGSSQPCRLPGGLREGEGRIQRLIYSKQGGVL